MKRLKGIKMDENKVVSQTQRKDTTNKLWAELKEAGLWWCLQKSS